MGKSYKRWKRRKAEPTPEPVVEIIIEEPKLETLPKPEPKKELVEKPQRKRSPLSKLKKTKPSDD